MLIANSPFNSFINEKKIDQDEYAKEVIVKFETEEFFKTRMAQFGGKVDYTHTDGKTYPVFARGSQDAPRKTITKIKLVPLGMDLEKLRKELEPFGKVERISRLQVDGDYRVTTERVTAIMILAPNKNIPSILAVEGFKLRVFYPGQPPTCMICSSPEHLAINCP